MIHLLYQELSDVYRTVLLPFLTLDHVSNKQGAALLLIDHKLVDKQIRIDEKETFFRGVRNMFQSIVSYLKSNLPLNNSFLRDLQILGFSYRSDPQGNDVIIDEWLMYSIEAIDVSWIIKQKYNDSERNEHIQYQEIDYFWNKVLSIVRSAEHPKYSTLSKLIKNILIISHGNADVERKFSTNGNILTDERTLLSEESI